MKSNTKSYFAAANGYTGFRDYFSSVFQRDGYAKIYILKGGPGTGKSSLMKRIFNAKEFEKRDKEAIYCSSDTSSLDGIILSNKIAIIDGTAPHEQDAKIPGAIDEIINLGAFWNSERLISRRDEIVDINKKKKQFYNSAYKYLSFCGFVDNYTDEILYSKFKKKKCENFVYDLNADFPNGKEKIRLISAFGKDGYKKLDTVEASIGNIYNIVGSYGEEFILMDSIKKRVKYGSACVYSPSPFSDNKTECIFSEASDTAFEVNAERGEKINAADFLNLSMAEEKELKQLINQKNNMLEIAKEHFFNAANEHFKLEEIYKDAMDFSKNEELTAKIIEEVSEILKASTDIS